MPQRSHCYGIDSVKDPEELALYIYGELIERITVETKTDHNLKNIWSIHSYWFSLSVPAKPDESVHTETGRIVRMRMRPMSFLNPEIPVDRYHYAIGLTEKIYQP